MRDCLEVIHFVSWERNADTANSTKFGAPSGEAWCILQNISAEQDASMWISSNITQFVCVSIQLGLATPLQVSFCAAVRSSLVFWAAKWNAAFAKLLHEVNCSIWGTWAQQILGHLWNTSVWWQGDGFSFLAMSHSLYLLECCTSQMRLVCVTGLGFGFWVLVFLCA